jgi:hypothetical protein
MQEEKQELERQVVEDDGLEKDALSTSDEHKRQPDPSGHHSQQDTEEGLPSLQNLKEEKSSQPCENSIDNTSERMQEEKQEVERQVVENDGLEKDPLSTSDEQKRQQNPSRHHSQQDTEEGLPSLQNQKEETSSQPCENSIDNTSERMQEEKQ